MQKSVVGLAVIGALVADPGMAADMAVKAPPAAPMTTPALSWTGCYVGGNVGPAWTRQTQNRVDGRERVVIQVVAIDGPAGSGKSTVARGVASALGLEVLDTGAIAPAPLDYGSESDSGPAGGVQVGCDYQFAPSWVLGAQGMFDWSDLSGSHALPPFPTFNMKARRIGFIRLPRAWAMSSLITRWST